MSYNMAIITDYCDVTSPYL